MTESPDSRRPDADPEESRVVGLTERLSSLERRLGSAEERPWWQRIEFLGPLSATLIAAIVSVTTVFVQQIARDREVQASAIQQQALLNKAYLDQAIEVHDDPLKREFALEFYSRVVQDPSVRNWAIGQLSIMRTRRQAEEAREREQELELALAARAKGEGGNLEQLERNLADASVEAATLKTRARDAERIATINNLIAPDQQTRWQAAEDLSSLWGRDPNLPSELLRFISDHADDPLALYNVVVVVEDLVKCCRDAIDEASLRQTLEVAERFGGPKTRDHIGRIREALPSD